MIKDNGAWNFVCPICKKQGIPSIYLDEDYNQPVCTNCSNDIRIKKGPIRDGSEYYKLNKRLASFSELALLLVIGAIIFLILYALKGH